MNQDILNDDVNKPIKEAPKQIQKIIERVLDAEMEKLYQKNPRYIVDDIVKIIDEEVKK